MMHPTNELFATDTVYTSGKTPEETMHEIVFLLKKPD